MGSNPCSTATSWPWPPPWRRRDTASVAVGGLLAEVLFTVRCYFYVYRVLPFYFWGEGGFLLFIFIFFWGGALFFCVCVVFVWGGGGGGGGGVVFMFSGGLQQKQSVCSCHSKGWQVMLTRIQQSPWLVCRGKGSHPNSAWTGAVPNGSIVTFFVRRSRVQDLVRKEAFWGKSNGREANPDFSGDSDHFGGAPTL